MSDPTTLRGVVHGKMIELDRDAGFPEGLPVSVVVQPLAEAGEGLKRSFGGWADEADDLDEYLKWNRQQRKTGDSGKVLAILAPQRKKDFARE